MLLEKLINLVGKSSVFYGSRSVVTSFATVRHWQVFWSRCMKSPADRTVSLRCILILYSHLHVIWGSSFPFKSSNQCVLRIIGAIHDCCGTPTSSSFLWKTYRPRYCFIIFSLRSDISLTWGGGRQGRQMHLRIVLFGYWVEEGKNKK